MRSASWVPKNPNRATPTSPRFPPPPKRSFRESGGRARGGGAVGGGSPGPSRGGTPAGRGAGGPGAPRGGVLCFWGSRNANRLPAVGAVRRPLLQLPRIERSLRARCGRAPQARGFARDGIAALRVGHVVVQRQPQARRPARRAARRGDPL